MDPPGRFLYMNNSTFKWDIVASNIAREKVCQTLRDAVAMEKDYKLLHEAINSSVLTPRKDNDDAISYKAEIASVKESAEVDIEEEEESCSENTRLLLSNDPQKEHSSASNPQQAWAESLIGSKLSTSHGHFTLDRIDYSADDGMHYICKFDDDDKDDKDYPMTYEDFKNHAYTSGLDVPESLENVPESPEKVIAMACNSTQAYRIGTRVSKMFFDEKMGVMRLYDGSVKSYGE